MPPVGFEPTISAGERPQTYALDRAASGTYLLYRRLSKYNAWDTALGEICFGNNRTEKLGSPCEQGLKTVFSSKMTGTRHFLANSD